MYLNRINNQAFTKVHPVFIIAGCLLFEGFLQNIWPMKFDPRILDIIEGVGVLLIAFGVAVLTLGYGCMIRERTSIIDAEKHTTHIVTTGVYAYSRNPIYLGWTVLFLGIAITDLGWVTILAPTMMLGLLHWLVVLEEEKYLEKRFGDEYLSYRAQVRRWL